MLTDCLRSMYASSGLGHVPDSRLSEHRHSSECFHVAGGLGVGV